MHGGVPHLAQNCSRWVWHDACRNPKDKANPYCERNPTFVLDPNFDDRPQRAEDKKLAKRIRAASRRM